MSSALRVDRDMHAGGRRSRLLTILMTSSMIHFEEDACAQFQRSRLNVDPLASVCWLPLDRPQLQLVTHFPGAGCTRAKMFPR
jgi:hypothetical protein